MPLLSGKGILVPRASISEPLVLAALGGIVLATGIFILIDRLLLGRPAVTIIPSKHTGDLRFQNLSKHAISLLSIQCWPRRVWIARDDTAEGIAAAAGHQTFNIVIQPWEILNFPIVIQRGELSDPKRVPFLGAGQYVCGPASPRSLGGTAGYPRFHTPPATPPRRAPGAQ
jgi:hypothetical protein